MIMSARPQLFEYQTASNLSTAAKDGLFLERLETFLEKSLLDIKAFADREQQSYDETRKHVAQWHAKYLFQPTTTTNSATELTGPERAERIKPILCDTSQILESLSNSWGVHSFFLAIDPYNPSDAGFLGGSLLGREFWRGLRSGGENGARSFRIHCTTHLQAAQKDVMSAQRSVRTAAAPIGPIPTPVRSVKSELYECVRNELRSVSGRRTAEMKWSNPERLDMYGVRVVGWPEGIPAQNPSSLKTGQNRQLLEAFQAGTMRFEKIGTHIPKIAENNSNPNEPLEDATDQDNAEDFSWAFDANAGQSTLSSSSASSPSMHHRMIIPASLSSNIVDPTRLSSTPTIREPEGYHEGGWDLNDPSLVRVQGSYNPDVDDPWDDMFHESSTPSSLAGQMWDSRLGELDDEGDLVSERPRKRQRSEEAIRELPVDDR